MIPAVGIGIIFFVVLALSRPASAQGGNGNVEGKQSPSGQDLKALTIKPTTLDPAQVVEQFINVSDYKGQDKFIKPTREFLMKVATSGGDVDTSGATCKDISPSKTDIGLGIGAQGAATTSTLTAGAVAGSTAALVGSIASIALAPIGLFSFFRAQHKAKVQQENNILCSIVPAFQDGRIAILNAVSKRQMTKVDATTAMKRLEQDAIQALQPIWKPCNAACGYQKAFQVSSVITQERIQNA